MRAQCTTHPVSLTRRRFETQRDLDDRESPSHLNRQGVKEEARASCPRLVAAAAEVGLNWWGFCPPTQQLANKNKEGK